MDKSEIAGLLCGRHHRWMNMMCNWSVDIGIPRWFVVRMSGSQYLGHESNVRYGQTQRFNAR